MVLLRWLKLLYQLSWGYYWCITGTRLEHLQQVSLSGKRWRLLLTHSHRERILFPRHTSWQHTFYMVMSGIFSCGSLQVHFTWRMGNGSISIWISTALVYLGASLYCTPLGATSSVLIPTPCLGTPTAFNTENQKSGRHYLIWRLWWTAPSSSQLSISIILHSMASGPLIHHSPMNSLRFNSIPVIDTDRVT